MRSTSSGTRATLVEAQDNNMPLTEAQILTAFEWSKPEEKITKRGPRILRKAVPSDAAMAFWKANQAELSAAGVTYGLKWKTVNIYELCWWQHIPESITQERSSNKELSRASDADVKIPIAQGMEYLPYQRAGIVFASRCFGLDLRKVNGERKIQGASGGCLIGDEPGLGKTCEAIGVINADESISRVLIICPLAIKVNWFRELRRFLVRPMSIGLADSQCWPTTDIVIVHYDVIYKWEKRTAFMWDLIVMDEIHRCKAKASRRSKAIFGYKPRKDEDVSLAKAGIPARRRLAMTGTPILNEREDLWPIINYLDPVTFNNWWTFNRKLSLAQMQDMLRERVMIRRLKKDVLTELPPKRRSIVPLPADEKAQVFLRRERAAMGEWENRLIDLEAAVELAKAGDDQARYVVAVKALRQGIQADFTEISRIRHETALAKLPACAEYIGGMLEETDKILIGAHHRDVIDQLHAQFAHVGALKIYGGMTPTETQRAVDLFQNDPNHRIIILSISVAVGMTLTAASNAVAVELDWVPANMIQWEDRCHRLGQDESVNIYHLVLEGSIDQNMAETLIEKQAVIDMALDKVSSPEAQEPITPLSGKKVKVTREQIVKAAEGMTPERIAAVHMGLKQLAGRCDGAQQLDGAGFSKVDAAVGHSLADCFYLTPKQAALGARLCVKYGRQLDMGLMAQINGKDTYASA